MFDKRQAHHWWTPPDAPPPLVELAIPDPSTLRLAQVDARLAVEVMVAAARASAQADGVGVGMVAALAKLRRAEAEAEAEVRNRTRRLAGQPTRPPSAAENESAERFIGDEVAAALRLPPSMGYQHVIAADRLVDGAPATFGALCAGRIDLARATRIAEGISDLSADQAARVEADLLAGAERQTRAQLNASIRRAVIAADTAAADRRHKAAHRRRCARLRAEDDGMATLSLTGRADRVSAAWQTATAVARHRLDQCKAATTKPAPGVDPGPLTLDQARVDALLDMLRSPQGLADTGDPEDVDVHVRIVAPVAAVGAAPAELDGYGPIAPGLVRDLIGQDPARRVTFTRWLVDPRGVVTATGSTAYRPPPVLDRMVRARDAHCRFPGCHRAARHCDLDHTVPHPSGSTCSSNLACLCRRHHRLKTLTRWTLDQLGGGILRWTSPAGLSYVTHPPVWLTQAAQSKAAEPTPPEPMPPEPMPPEPMPPEPDRVPVPDAAVPPF